MTQILATAPLVTALHAHIVAELKYLPQTPHLHVVMVGDNAASALYIKRKETAALNVGINFTPHHLCADTTQAELNAFIQKLSSNDSVTGVLLQLPLPDGFDSAQALNFIPAEKDIDGLTDSNQKHLTTPIRHILPATPLGIMRILEWAEIPIKNAKTVVLGESKLVGAPIAKLLQHLGAQVQTFNSTSDLTLKNSALKQADIIVSAAGCPNLVTPDLVKPSATVIDVGINRSPEGLLVGDTTSLAGYVAALTPVPGGVGPMTVASLLTNVIDAAAWQQGLPPIQWQIPARVPLA